MQLCFLVTNTSEVHHTTQKQAETYILADYRPRSLPLIYYSSQSGDIPPLFFLFLV